MSSPDGVTAQQAQPDPVSPDDLGVSREAAVEKLSKAFACTANDVVGTTSCVHDEVTVTLQGRDQLVSLTFVFPIGNRNQLTAASVTMVALANLVFPGWAFGKWYERNLPRMKQGTVSTTQRGILLRASPLGPAKDRLLVVWTVRDEPIQ